MTDTTKSQFALIIDEDRAKLLQMLCNAGRIVGDLAAIIKEEGLEDTLEQMSKDNADRMHERGWCADPLCVKNES